MKLYMLPLKRSTGTFFFGEKQNKTLASLSKCLVDDSQSWGFTETTQHDKNTETHPNHQQCHFSLFVVRNSQVSLRPLDSSPPGEDPAFVGVHRKMAAKLHLPSKQSRSSRLVNVFDSLSGLLHHSSLPVNTSQAGRFCRLALFNNPPAPLKKWSLSCAPLFFTFFKSCRKFFKTLKEANESERREGEPMLNFVWLEQWNGEEGGRGGWRVDRRCFHLQKKNILVSFHF